MVIEELKAVLEFYKWVLKFDPKKYLGIALMVLAPLFFIFRFIFMGSHLYELIFGSLGFFIFGVYIWQQAWDPLQGY